MSKYRRMVFTSIRESCKSKLPAGGNATWMQGSVKVPGGEVHVLPAKRPLARLATLATLSPRERAVLITPARTRKDSLRPGERVVFSHAQEKRQPSPRGEGARRRRAGEGSLPIPLGFDGTPPHIVR
jgi:hypothetical protein